MFQKTLQIYHKVIYYGVLAAMFLPLVFWRDTFSPFHFTKVMLFRLLVEILFLLWVVLALADKRFRPKVNVIFILVNVWFLAYLVTGFLGVDFARSFWGTLERVDGFILQLHFWMFFIVLISVFRNKEDWLKLLKVSIVASFLSSLYALGQKADISFFLGAGRERVFGTMGNPALFAGYTLFNFFWALYFILKKDTGSAWRKVLLFVAALQFVTIFMTAVRGAIIAVLFGLALLSGFYVFLSKNKKLKMAAASVLVLVVVTSFSFYFARNTEVIQNNAFLKRVTDISLSAQTVQTRLVTWDIAWQAFKEKPIFGWGPENFSVAFAYHFDPFFFTGFGAETYWDRAHNVFLNILTTMGLFGMAIYMALIGGILWLLYKVFKEGDDEARLLGAVMFVILAVYHIHTFFILDVFSTYLMLFVFFGLSYFVYRKFSEEVPEEKPVVKKPNKGLLGVGLTAVFIFSFPLVWAPLSANHAGTRAVVAGWQMEAAVNAPEAEKYHLTAMTKFKEALEGEVFPAYELRHKLASYVYSSSKNDRLSEETRKEALVYAISETQKNIDEHPLDYLSYLYLGRLYAYRERFEEGSAVKAEEVLREALKYNPKYTRTYYELGQAQILQSEYEAARQTYQKAVDLSPKMGAGYWYLAVAYRFLENWIEAAKAIELAVENGYELAAPDEFSQVIMIYDKLGKTEKTIEWSEKLVETSPTAQNYASLAAAYRGAGLKQKAIAAAQKAAQLDPENYEAASREFINLL